MISCIYLDIKKKKKGNNIKKIKSSQIEKYIKPPKNTIL